MRDLPGRLFVVIAAAVAVVVGIGYAAIALNVARPPADTLGQVEVPSEMGARPIQLADGRPAFIVRWEGGIHVVDARVPVADGVPGRLVTWCNGQFLDWLDPATAYDSHGSLIGGMATRGLTVYPFTTTDDGRSVIVGTTGEPAPPHEPQPGTWACEGESRARHEPETGEVFDPSVAADEEPPGWIWLEGRLEAIGGQALLCDDLDANDCETGAVVRGIDPGRLAGPSQHLSGLFLGRVGDGAIEELHYAPASTEGT
jgi:hypothetical protein